ncbi:integrase/recombinase XerC [Pedobacter sp. UYP30]|uniref:tyrosine-type recombinase/integrase n=1 Tax=Pedobacter sp. UYP30 TaxID=1756400 RepID=UPI00339ACB21
MLLKSFVTYLSHEKRYSQHTLTSYSKDLLAFEAYLAATFELGFLEVKPTYIRSYMMHLMEEGFSAKTVNRKISTMRSFYKFLLREGKTESNPAAVIKAPKIPKRLPVFVDAAKMDSLLDSDIVFGNNFPHKRDHLVIELLFGTGIRLTELLGIRESDLNIYEQTIKVLGKRNKERVVPVTKALSLEIQDFIATKKIQNFDNNVEALIVTDKGLPAYPKLIYRIVTAYLSLVTTNDKKSPHVLRHSYATSLLNNGADLNAIKELLGHASLAATQVYTHNSIERLKSIYKQAHPKA